MASFRELFDEREREEIILAMQARESQLKSRMQRALRGETARGETTAERLEMQLDLVRSIIKTLCEEHS